MNHWIIDRQRERSHFTYISNTRWEMTAPSCIVKAAPFNIKWRSARHTILKARFLQTYCKCQSYIATRLSSWNRHLQNRRGWLAHVAATPVPCHGTATLTPTMYHLQPASSLHCLTWLWQGDEGKLPMENRDLQQSLWPLASVRAGCSLGSLCSKLKT